MFRNRKTLQFRSGNGRFRKGTIEDMGISKSLVNHEVVTCKNCGNEWFPILITGLCDKCGMANVPGPEFNRTAKGEV